MPLESSSLLSWNALIRLALRITSDKFSTLGVNIISIIVSFVIFNFFSKNKKSIVDPQNSWLKSSLKDYLMDNINTSGLKEIEILNSKEVKKYCQDFVKGKISSSFLIFTILTSIKFINYFKKY